MYIYLYMYFCPEMWGSWNRGQICPTCGRYACAAGSVVTLTPEEESLSVGGARGYTHPNVFLFNSLFLEPLESLMQNAYGEG